MPSNEPHTGSLCGAKTRSGGSCTQRAMPNGRCRMHGGKSPGAPIKHGRRSKFLKDARLAERLEAAMSNTELTKQIENLATIEMMITSKMEELGAESGAELWKQAGKDFSALKAAIATGEADEFLPALRKLGATIENGTGHEKRLEDIRELIQEQAAVAKVEISRREKEDRSLTEREAALFRQRLLSIVIEEVTDAIAQLGADDRIIKLRLARIAARFAQAYGS